MRDKVVITVLGLVLVVVGILSATLFQDGRSGHLIYGIIVGFVGVVAMIYPWTVLRGNE